MLSNYQLSELLIDQSQPFVHITLNRPEALNALTLEMTRVYSMLVDKIASDRRIKGVIVSGAGDRAFCAGGDIKNLYSHGMAFRKQEIPENIACIFFEEEYDLNARIKTLGKPYVAFLNGITMGGGYGLAGHGTHVVATERTVFAMPEVKIGFFPDIGATYNLVRCTDDASGALGMYLALSGTSIGPDDMYYAGLCGFIAQATRFDRIRAALGDKIKASDAAGIMENVTDVLSGFHKAPKDASMLERERERIERCFSKASVEAIIAEVQKDNSEWGQRTNAELAYASPTSLRVTFEQMKRAKTMTFDQVMAQDLTLARHFVRGHDLFEGIKAAVIDKERNPRWSPDHVGGLSPREVEAYFAAIPGLRAAKARS